MDVEYRPEQHEHETVHGALRHSLVHADETSVQELIPGVRRPWTYVATASADVCAVAVQWCASANYRSHNNDVHTRILLASARTEILAFSFFRLSKEKLPEAVLGSLIVARRKSWVFGRIGRRW